MPFIVNQASRTSTTAAGSSLSNRRRGGPFKGNLQFWLDADSLSLNNDDTVASYSSKIGEYNASQASSSLRPVFKTNVVNSLPAIRFNGSSHFLDLGTNLGKPASWTIMTVFSIDTTSISSAICGSADSLLDESTAWGSIFVNGYQDSTPYVLNSSPNNGALAYVFGDDTNVSEGETDAGTLEASTFFIATLTYGDTNDSAGFRLNGQLKNISAVGSTAASATSGTAYKFSIGKFGENASRYFDGDVASLLVYDKELSTSEIAVSENYLSSKYNISLS